MTNSKQCEGYCPYCGADSLTQIDNDEQIYEYHCDHCHKEFSEVYKKVYIETQYDPRQEVKK